MPKSLYPHLHRGWGYSDFGENLFYHTLKIKNAELVTLILHFLFSNYAAIICLNSPASTVSCSSKRLAKVTNFSLLSVNTCFERS